MKAIRVLLWLVVVSIITPASVSAFYNPSSGRWLSRDPIGERGGRNLYAFGFNCPISKYDPFGRETRTFQTGGGSLYTYTVTVDVFPNLFGGLCHFLTPPSLMIPMSFSTHNYEPIDANYPFKDVRITVDGEAFPITTVATAGGSEFIFSTTGSKFLSPCPQGLQKGSIVVKGQYHDNNCQGDCWLTGFTVVIDWTYQCRCDCLGGYVKPFETRFTWKGWEPPDE